MPHITSLLLWTEVLAVDAVIGFRGAVHVKPSAPLPVSHIISVTQSVVPRCAFLRIYMPYIFIFLLIWSFCLVEVIFVRTEGQNVTHVVALFPFHWTSSDFGRGDVCSCFQVSSFG